MGGASDPEPRRWRNIARPERDSRHYREHGVLKAGPPKRRAGPRGNSFARRRSCRTWDNDLIIVPKRERCMEMLNNG